LRCADDVYTERNGLRRFRGRLRFLGMERVLVLEKGYEMERWMGGNGFQKAKVKEFA
jgi:hypothetical protein